MYSDAKRAEFLAKAKDAEDRAERVSDPIVKKLWEDIARGYRELAVKESDSRSA